MISTKKAQKLRQAIKLGQIYAVEGYPTLWVMGAAKHYGVSRKVALHAYYAKR